MRLEAAVDLAATLHGGQAFRWRADADGGWRGEIGGRVVELRATAGGLHATGATRRALHSYFRLDAEDAARRLRLRRDPVIGPALAASPGLRLLRQDPWETTIAFIASANNNVLRIEGIVRGIAERWGEELDHGVHAFPPPTTLARATERALRAVGLGYRAPFVRATARAVARGDVDLDELRGAPLGEIRPTLFELPGVGPKVADCVALFSLDADDAFPIDRWVLRAVSDAFFEGAPVTPREAEAFARERWGRDAGLAQQLLFHAVRLGGSAPGTARLKGSIPAA